MRKLALATLATALLATAPAFGQTAKFAAHVKDLTIVQPSNGFGWQEVLRVPMKTPNKKDLLIGVSLETGIYTRTAVKGKGGATDTANAQGALFVRVKVDGSTATPNVEPDQVTYDKRIQTLTATLGGVIDSCADTGTFTDGAGQDNDTIPDGVITVAFECVATDEEIELVLETMAAHHFNFVAADLGAGDHVITVEVLGDTNGDGDFDATVTVGRGAVTVEQVRAVNQGTGIIFDN
jgi:hypothetical protein